MADKSESQGGRTWPLCDRCGKQIIPDGFGTSLKPAVELICLARKPLSEGTIAANFLKHGCGALNIDECRIPLSADDALQDGVHHDGHALDKSKAYGFKAVDRPAGLGRWPANVLHDGSDEVEAAFAAFGDRPSTGDHPSDSRGTGNGVAHPGKRHQGQLYSDSGTASRFFFCARPDAHCGLCNVPLDASNVKQEACDAHNVENSSTILGTTIEDSVRYNAAESPPQGSADNGRPMMSYADNAENRSAPCHRQARNSVPENVDDWPVSRIAQNVRSAGSLCSSCATAIALKLAAIRRGQDPALLPCLGFINERFERILNHSLALYVAGRESTDTILTIPSLNQWSGSAFLAIADTTSRVKDEALANTDPGLTRFRFSSKANASDRAGSKHPTVKPTDLMRWLVRLVTPPNGVVLDPFAGTGSTGLAADQSGFDAVLIEQSAEYCEDIRRKITSDAPLFTEVS